MMYCLRTFLPLLLLPLPLSLSPIHLTTLLILIYALNRPCVYCSLLLIILFASSCHWSGRCFWTTSGLDLGAVGANETIPWQWGYIPYFIPRLYTTPIETGTSGNETAGMASFLMDIANSTISTFAGSAISSAVMSGSQVLSKAAGYAPSLSIPNPSGAGAVGIQWLRTLFGRGEWTLPCVNIKVAI